MWRLLPSPDTDTEGQSVSWESLSPAHPGLVGWPGWPSEPHPQPHALGPLHDPLALQDAHTQHSLGSISCSEQAALARRRQGPALVLACLILGTKKWGDATCRACGCRTRPMGQVSCGTSPQGPEHPQGSGCVPRRLPPGLRSPLAATNSEVEAGLGDLEARLSARP